MAEHKPTAEQIIEKLDLEPHPEGGFFRRSFCDEQKGADGRPVSTAIYYLLKVGESSQFHKIDVSEGWHFYAGDPIEITELGESGPTATRLGRDVLAGDKLQKFVPPNTWFAARLIGDGSWALVGCTVAPGFLMENFVLGERGELIRMFPKCRDVIEAMTQED